MTKKQKLMRDYFMKEDALEIVSYQEAQERLKDCKWCDKFRDAKYLHCLHCGVALR